RRRHVHDAERNGPRDRYHADRRRLLDEQPHDVRRGTDHRRRERDRVVPVDRSAAQIAAQSARRTGTTVRRTDFGRRCWQVLSSTNCCANKILVSTRQRGLPTPRAVFIDRGMKIRPLHDRILVKRLEEETKTSGGLFIPDSAKEKPIQAKVVAVGAGKRDKDGKIIALEVKAGDRVLFSKYSGTEVKIDGEEHLIMREDDLLAVLD